MLKGSQGDIRQQSQDGAAMGYGRHKEPLPFGDILQTHYNKERKQKPLANGQQYEHVCPIPTQELPDQQPLIFWKINITMLRTGKD